jgi:hypothetical protein
MSKINFSIRSITQSAIGPLLFFGLLSPLITGPANAADITNIKQVVNNTPFSVEVRKADSLGGSSETTGVVMRGHPWTGDMWIPWADNSAHFDKARIELRYSHDVAGRYSSDVGGPVQRGQERWVAWRWIWQSGPLVRYTTRARFVTNGDRVPGLAKSGG